MTYGLGSENQNLPGYVVIYDAHGGPFGGPANWGAGFMPAAYQGTVFRSSGAPIIDLKPPAEVAPEQQRARLDLLNKLNEMDAEKYPGNTELTARIASYELAYRMQSCAPEAVDVKRTRGDAQAVRHGRRGDGAVRTAMSDGAEAGRARGAVRAAVSWRPGRAERGHLGRA